MLPAFRTKFTSFSCLAGDRTTKEVRMRNNTVTLAVVGLVTLFALYVVLPLPHPAWLVRSEAETANSAQQPIGLKLGLDLQGGTQVMLEADLLEGQTIADGAMSTAKTIVENRVNGLGVNEAVVQLQGDNRIVVELPGVSNPDQAIETVRSTGQLEFVDPSGQVFESGMIINTTNRPDAVARAIASGTVTPDQVPYADTIFPTAMTGEILREAVVRPDQFGRPEIGFVLTGPGSELFYAYTSAHVGDQLAIVLDGRVLSAPNINQAIRDQGVISGQFTNEEAESLAVQMRYGALPISLKVVDVRTIGATLGADSVRSSVVAGAIGLIAVFIFMITLFRLSGVIASVALILYILFNLAIYKLVPITLTLAGIAGFLLSIGMAVDANILIFSRMREELRGGRSLRLAVEAGFSRAWPAILDSNLTTLISCAVLFWFGSTFGASVVKGYALNLAVGVAISMLTAVYITRSFMRALIGNRTNMTDAQARSMVGM